MVARVAQRPGDPVKNGPAGETHLLIRACAEKGDSDREFGESRFVGAAGAAHGRPLLVSTPHIRLLGVVQLAPRFIRFSFIRISGVENMSVVIHAWIPFVLTASLST